MKLLHLGLMVNGRDEGLSAAFRKRFNGFGNYREFPITENVADKCNYSGFTPDAVFVQVQSDTIGKQNTVNVLGGLLKKYKEQGATVINWTGDIRNSVPSWMNQIKESVSLTCFSNERDVRNFHGDSKFLQIGIDPLTFKPRGLNKETDVVFMGNNYGNQFPLSSKRRELCKELRRYNVEIYGNYPQAVRSLNPDPKNPFPVQSEESKIYSRSKIAISMSHYQEPRYTSDRLLRAMGSGIMVLAHHYPDIEKDFQEGVHLETFKGWPEMHEKINYYLNNEKEREAIAQMGCEHIHNNFTYDNMVENIIKIHEDWKR